VRVTVLGYQDHGVGSSNEAGHGYRDLHVRVCSLKAQTVGNGPWSLVGNDDSHNGTMVTGGGLHEPQYPDAVTTQAGECVSGWITFDVPKKVDIVAAKYAPRTTGSHPGYEAIWKV
jgi:hypothetical protein